MIPGYWFVSAKSSLGFAGVYLLPRPRLVGGADPARPQLVARDLERVSATSSQAEPLVI